VTVSYHIVCPVVRNESLHESSLGTALKRVLTKFSVYQVNISVNIAQLLKMLLLHMWLMTWYLHAIIEQCLHRAIE